MEGGNRGRVADAFAQYTSFWNLVNYPAAVFPTGMFSTVQDVEDGSYKARNAREQYVLDTYNAGVSAGVGWDSGSVQLGVCN